MRGLFGGIDRLFKGPKEFLHGIKDDNGAATRCVPAPRVGASAWDAVPVVTHRATKQLAFDHALKDCGACQSHMPTNTDASGDIAIEVHFRVRTCA